MALVKQVEDLVAGLSPHHQEAIETLVGQLTAMKPVTKNGIITSWIPDEIIRQKAAIAILEWLHGKPRELQVQVRGDFEDLEALRARMASLPSLQNTSEGQKAVLWDAAREQASQPS